MKAFFKAFLGFFATLAVFGIILVFAVNSFFSNNLSKREIIKLVNTHSDIILADIEEDNFEDTLSIKGITDIRVNDVVDVHCGGKGFGSQTAYYGFYYISDDKPMVMFNGYVANVSNGDFVAEDNGFSYTERHGDGTLSDNTYYTEKIVPNFYYYERHF